MNIKSKDEIRDIIAKDLLSIHERSVELHNRLKENFEDSVTYIRALVSQLSQPSSGPLIAKTPKIVRKKAIQRIETIPEDEVFQGNKSSMDSLQSVNQQKRDTSEERADGRAKRSASKKAADNIKKQYSISLAGKLRQPSDENEDASAAKVKTDSQAKRKKSVYSSSDEEDTKNGSKYSKIESENLMETKRSMRKKTKKKSDQIDQRQPVVALKKLKQIVKSNEKDTSESLKSIRSSRSRSKKSEQEQVNKNDDMMSNTDEMEEPSMYEDAIGKPIPIMNSTMKSSSASVLPGKALDVTVVLGRLSQPRKLNETVVIQKESSEKNEQSKKRTSSRNNLQSNEQTTQYNNYNELITDDESSPEVKKQKMNLNRALSTSSEDEIPNTPMKSRFKDKIASTVSHETKNTYKSNALFSPYAKESVKKRVEAFEQAVMYSPKSIDVDVPTRVTRTKTRAMIAAETEAETKNPEKNVAQVLARKSVAKAKKISLAKQKKGNEEIKEQMPEPISKLLLNDKPNIKQMQLQKMTPLSKIKPIQSSTSANRMHTPSHVQNLLNYPKSLTASRTNIISNIDSFIQPPKNMNKINSVEKLEDKRRHEEDARKKREEALRLQTEEKKRKRQEKELKNKLAREAKERQELEKRQKAEKEREEKARLALLMQEKQREELEKKRLAQLQRAQEKEERRKLEEQQRLQKLQEQEETERLLAEQKRREQEAEKRKEMEARAAEALKQKNQMLAAQAKLKQANNKNQATNYILDSDPDDDESDDESRPKHEIPYWAQPHIRKAQLAMQRYITPHIVYKFFGSRKCTPNLAELFVGIDRTRLERTSSAIWKTPPRFSMMETDP